MCEKRVFSHLHLSQKYYFIQQPYELKFDETWAYLFLSKTGCTNCIWTVFLFHTRKSYEYTNRTCIYTDDHSLGRYGQFQTLTFLSIALIF